MSEKEKRVFFTQEWQKHEREVTYPYYRAKSEVTENDRGSYVYERVERTKITRIEVTAGSQYKISTHRNTSTATSRDESILYMLGSYPYACTEQQFNEKMSEALAAIGVENPLGALERAATDGVPVPLKMWLSAAGINLVELEKDIVDGEDLRVLLTNNTINVLEEVARGIVASKGKYGVHAFNALIMNLRDLISK